MSILMSMEIKKQIVSEVKRCNENLQVITAFCKESGVQFMDCNISNNIVDKRLMVRFRMDDIISGVSDLSVYDYCKNNGWKVYIRFDLHAKTYIFDNKRCIIGSANLTNKGLNLYIDGNYEIASICEIEPEDINKVNELFDNALLLDDDLYLKMKKEIDAVSIEKKNIMSGQRTSHKCLYQNLMHYLHMTFQITIAIRNMMEKKLISFV